MTDPNCTLVTRRTFLGALGSGVVLAACGGKTIALLSPEETVGAVPIESLGVATNRVLVVVELGGGNDGLSMVVPHGDDRYHDLRRSTRIENAIDLDGSIGFHPNLENLAARYGQGEVAIVEGVGMPDPDLSHFTSMDRWWTGAPTTSESAGWLGRYLDGTVGFDDPLAGIVIGPGPSRAMLGKASYTVAISDSTGLAPQVPDWIDNVDELVAMWGGFVPEDPTDIDLAPVQRAIEATVTARTELASVFGVGSASRSRRQPTLTGQLELAAQLITSDRSPTVVYIHGYGDFDTHRDQVRRHGQLMAELDQALSGFFATLESAGHADRVTVLTASEFGRRAGDNGSGTDHGTVNAQLVIGAGVNGGRHGEPPSLTKLDTNSNLIHTVDYRSLYATLLSDWLESDSDEILDGAFERLPLLS